MAGHGQVMARNRQSRNEENAAPQRVALGVRRQPRPEEPLGQDLVSDLGAGLAVTNAELDAIEQLLGEDLRTFLGAPN